MKWFNHYSVWIFGALLLVGVLTTRRRTRWILTGALAAYAAVCLLWRPVGTATPATAGLPLLLEIQSPYCFGCVVMKPAVDRLEKELAGRLQVQRVDIQSDQGRQLARQHGVEFTPTFILFHAEGRELWRGVGRLDEDNIRAMLEPTP